ncbi:hypothetical protein D9M71_801850 [compost metagenome]
MVDEIGAITAVRPNRNWSVGRHQPAALIIVDGDATKLWHQRFLTVNQGTQPFNLRGAATFDFQTFDEAEQQQRTLADDAFGVRRKSLS